VMELCETFQIPCAEVPFTRHDVYVADEVFLTGTAAEMIPVVNVDGRIIGSGKPGPLTAKLTKAFRQLTVQRGTKVPGIFSASV
jgi:branched-chain amino acid aminotransferase